MEEQRRESQRDLQKISEKWVEYARLKTCLKRTCLVLAQIDAL